MNLFKSCWQPCPCIDKKNLPDLSGFLVDVPLGFDSECFRSRFQNLMMILNQLMMIRFLKNETRIVDSKNVEKTQVDEEDEVVTELVIKSVDWGRRCNMHSGK